MISVSCIDDTLPIWVRVDLGVMIMKRYSVSPSDSLVSYPRNTLFDGVLLLCTDTVAVFYSQS